MKYPGQNTASSMPMSQPSGVSGVRRSPNPGGWAGPAGFPQNQVSKQNCTNSELSMWFLILRVSKVFFYDFEYKVMDMMIKCIYMYFKYLSNHRNLHLW